MTPGSAVKSARSRPHELAETTPRKTMRRWQAVANHFIAEKFEPALDC